ncbi:MAG: LysE family transporter, partial [bacterium]|nr:LysE family transporter [bacterium]
MLTIILFYFFSFWFGFLLCIPIGPVNLEVFNTALKKQYPQAVAVALGGALGDAIWAITAFFGVTPFQTPKMEGFFFIATALITGVLGFLAIKDSKFIGKKEDGMVHKIKRKRWAFLKGLTMVMVNPLGVVSWMICLQFLKKTGFYIPLELRYEIIFFL